MTHRTIANNQSQIDEDDFAKVDRFLDVVETAMLSVASKHNLRETQIQRWRWDQPEILMSWLPFQQSPEIGKNIRTLVKFEPGDAFTCSFESNAWFDDGQYAETYVRYWDHFPIGTVPHVDPQTVEIAEGRSVRHYIEKAYEAVSDSRNIRLSHAIRISTSGEAEAIEGSAVIGTHKVSVRGPGNT